MAETNGNGSTKANGSAKRPAVDISVALQANDLGSVPKLSKGIFSLSTAASDGDEAARLELVEKARALVRALETPRETMIKHCWAQVSQPPSNLFISSSQWLIHLHFVALGFHRLDSRS